MANARAFLIQWTRRRCHVASKMRSIAGLAGLAPMTRKLGKWRGQAAIQDGRKFLRDALYMPALVAAIGIGPDARRRVLGVSVALSETEVHWRAFLECQDA